MPAPGSSGPSDACSGDGYHDCASPSCDCACHAPIRLIEEALHLLTNGEFAPGGCETWPRWIVKAEAFLRDAARRRVLYRLWLARCELDRDVVREMGDDALLAHLHDAHPDGGA